MLAHSARSVAGDFIGRHSIRRRARLAGRGRHSRIRSRCILGPGASTLGRARVAAGLGALRRRRIARAARFRPAAFARGAVSRRSLRAAGLPGCCIAPACVSGLAVAGVLTRLACAGLATAGGIGCSLSTLLTLLSRILAGLGAALARLALLIRSFLPRAAAVQGFAWGSTLARGRACAGLLARPGVIGAWLFVRWQYDALLAPALLTGLTGLGYVLYQQWARWRR